MRAFDDRLRRLQRDPARLRRGLLALAALAVAYMACILLLAIGGARPGTDPWLAIPLDTYFYWEALFIGPVIFAGGMLAAAAIHLTARAVGGRGEFDDGMALVGTATAIASLATLVPDTIIGALLCAGVIEAAAWMDGVTHPSPTLAFVWSYLFLYVAAFLALYPAVARVAYGLRGVRAVLTGVTGFAVYQAFLYIFVR
jgi:hypothetical protein